MTYKEKIFSLAANGNELFDLSVPQTRKVYEEEKRREEKRAESRDTTSWREIANGIRKACDKHDGDGVVFLMGAYPHIIGALVNLVREGSVNVQYVPLGGFDISTNTPDKRTVERKPLSEEDIRRQMRRVLEVARKLGFLDMEDIRDFVQNAPKDSSKRTMTVIVQPETGLHQQCISKDMRAAENVAHGEVTRILTESKEKPNFLFFSGEDVNIQGFKDMLLNLSPSASFDHLLLNLKQSGISVEVGSFGHKDNVAHSYTSPLTDYDLFPKQSMFPHTSEISQFKGPDRSDAPLLEATKNVYRNCV